MQQLLRWRVAAAVTVVAGLAVVGGAATSSAAGASPIKVPCAAAGPDAGAVAAVDGTALSQLGVVQVLVNRSHVAPGGEATVETAGPGGSIEQGTVSLSADGTTYTLDLGLAPSSGSPFTPVGTATYTHTVAGSVTTSTLDETWSYDVATAVATRLKKQGDASFSLTDVTDPSQLAPGIKRSTVGDFTGYERSSTDPHGPEDGSYTEVSEPGVGSEFDVTDSVTTACKHAVGSPTSTELVDRAYGTSAKTTNERLDYQATGGVVLTGDREEAVICQAKVPSRASYTLNKLEDGSGNTIQSVESGSNSGATPACDPVFGPVPLSTGPGDDYAFGTPVTFPGEW